MCNKKKSRAGFRGSLAIASGWLCICG